MKIIAFAILCLGMVCSYGQSNTDVIIGKVYELDSDTRDTIPLIGANVVWLGDHSGTATDVNGAFTLRKNTEVETVVISYTGYQSDTIKVGNLDKISVQLSSAVTLDEVKVQYRKKSSEVSMIDPVKMENISEEELRKAACCNLSESFGTSPSVDVSFTDAVTGTRQIKMLGLASAYAQITRESMPNVRGLSSTYGLTFIPGPWVSSMQLNKGTGSAINGFESISGQINVEMKKPENMEKLHLNVYGNEGGRMEGNALYSQSIGEKWSTALFLHGKINHQKNDRNNDGFLDKPVGDHLIGLNRWKYNGTGNVRMQMGVKATYIDNIGGQSTFDPESPVASNSWGMTNRVNRLEGWAKIGILSPLPWQSMGFQLSASYHDQESTFGNKEYLGKETSLYANYIFQSIVWNTNHGIKLGASFQYDKQDEQLLAQDLLREEWVPGVYGEYSYKALDNFDLVAGMRWDHSNRYGTFFTPRLHLRYAITDQSVLRASVGRGQRTASVIAENFGALSSSRQWIFENATGYNLGFQPEVAWNFGINFTQGFKLDYRDGSMTFDLYRTDFQNRIIADFDESPGEIHFYNLEGKSFSNVFQAQLDYELVRNLDLRIAYRWIDARTRFESGLREIPLNSKNRAFVNLAYSTWDENWKFDATLNWQGEKRIPDTEINPVEYRLPEYSPAFYTINTQVTRIINSDIEIYIGGENILNYVQENPIIASEDPFSDFFDGTMVWGPVFGRNIYLGARYTIP
ncbi:TonB-dependent receptor [Membranihabitans maritimus]|uniref:TonB-dependent receptor n=1 Tax=Membranihabitans maritimus TaxID=2904244 RepID=UPI001F233D7E|nr:TonB-dependent receptor [Membranihabitans maritimus]